MTQCASSKLDSRVMNWSEIARRLVAWHAEHQRVLPWRDTPPGARDPYAVWVSEIMAQQTRLEVVVDYFRRWMARNGQRDKPLIVTEYGILMPPEYGFPPEKVTEFMRATFDYLLNARDEEIGYPSDDNRLVQKLAWYSLSDTVYPTGNLLDPVTGDLTLLGEAFADYTASLGDTQ